MLKGLIPYFGDKYLHEITTWFIEKYRHERRTENHKSPDKSIKPATLNREIALLKHMFTKAIEWGFLKENPAKSIKLLKENNRRLRFLSEDEINRLLTSCSGYLRDIVLLALNTGMRKGEIFNLKWQDVDLDLRMIHVSDSKNYEARDIPINDILYETLKALREKSGEGQEYVFVNPKTGRPYDDLKRSFKSLKEGKDRGLYLP